MTKSERVRELHKSNPDMTTADLAEEIGCSRRLVRNALQGIRTGVSPAKILLFDLETAPMEAYVWRLWKQTILPHQVIKDWSILSWSAKWLFDSEVEGQVVTPVEAHARSDSRIVKLLWEKMEEADIVIAHNARAFDIKKMNTRFLLAGLNPPTPYRVIDTLTVLRRTFGFSSAKMEDVNIQLGLMNKLEHEGMNMWKKCVNGSRPEAAQALLNMLQYNKVDVLALEDLYLALRPWIKSHPNVNLYQSIDEEEPVIRCANCGMDSLSWGGKYYTPAGRFDSYRCNNCGAIGRSRYSDLTKEDKEVLGMSIAS